jgi:hypothetical protein
MTINNFREEIKQHLTHYKKDVLNINEMGINGNKEFKRPYEHILPERLSRLNIMKQYRDDFFSSKYAEIETHDCFHHLNSSQALCINLFYPLIAEDKLRLIAELLNLPDDEIKNPAFEFIADLEQVESGRTNFDFYFEIAQQSKVYVELKYTENKFGNAKINRYYRDKFEKTYLPLLVNNPYIRKEFKSMVPFLENYQIMRNLVHIGDDSTVVFLYPEANPEIHEQALCAFEEMVTERGRQHLKLLALEETLQHITSSLNSGRLKNHFDEFIEKYLLSSIKN